MKDSFRSRRPWMCGASKTEIQVLKVLWILKRATAREVMEVLEEQKQSWAYTTVLTLLQRLLAKGYIACDKGGLAHVFTPIVSRQDLLKQRLGEIADQLTGGAAAPLMQALVENHQFTSEDLESFRKLLDQAEIDDTVGSSPRKKKKR